MPKQVILKAEHIYKSFGPTKAVQDFSMEIHEGEIHGLIGENGSGKSTFSSIAAGVLKMDSGKLTVQGEDYCPRDTNEAAGRGVAMVVQEIGTIGDITVADNIFLNKESRFAKKGFINYRKMHKEAKEILEKIGGEHLEPGVNCDTLNLEDRKLVEIARAMYGTPKLLIVDETSNALASRGREILYKNMRAIRDNGGAVLFITHDLDELAAMCDSVTIMRDGLYIDTLDKEDIQIKKLKELMVGREIADSFYRSDFSPQYSEEVVMRAALLEAPGVDGVSLELHKGEILGIGGLADSGMHELGRLLFGLDKADAGKVETGKGVVITSPQSAVKNRIGYLSKNRDTEAIILNYSINDNVVLPSLNDLRTGPVILHKNEKKLSEKWADELAVKRNDVEQFCSELSGGNKQKVVLAKWMANGSKILLMDCPTRGIDIGVKEAIYKLMMRFKEEGCAMLLISEEMTELIGMSDRILVMKNGSIVKEVMRSENVTESEIIQCMM